MSLTELIESPEAIAVLDKLTDSQCVYDESRALTLSTSLRSHGFSPSIASEILTQYKLRSQAINKFGSYAKDMLFTQTALEQATRLAIARLHALRFCDAGLTHVFDFGCGIGADSYAFAQADLHVTAIERDAAAYRAAQYNLRSFAKATVYEGDAHKYINNTSSAHALWVDPARRLNGKRIYDPQQWSPSLNEAIAYASRFLGAGIKIAPGIDYSYLPADCRTEWISDRGHLIEAVMWLGRTAPGRGRSATMIDTQGAVTHFDSYSGDPRDDAVLCEPAAPETYLLEPDPAIIRSGGLATYANRYGLAPVSHGIAYLTPVSGALRLNPHAETNTRTEPLAKRFPWTQIFHIERIMKANIKEIARHLHELNIGRVEIKKRGTDIDPQRVRKQFKLDSRNQGERTVIFTPILGQHRAIVATRESLH